MGFITGRLKELTSLHGGVLIGLGVVALFFSPIAKIAAWAAIAYGAWAVLKKDQKVMFGYLKMAMVVVMITGLAGAGMYLSLIHI